MRLPVDRSFTQRDDSSDYIYGYGVRRLGTSCLVIIVRGTVRRVKLHATTLVAAIENEKKRTDVDISCYAGRVNLL